MRTRDEGDMDRIRLKYGENIMKSVVKASVGSGMFVNAEYNKGAPYIVSFRPMYHNIERLSDEELKKYFKYNNMIDDIEYQIEQLEQENVDVFDVKIELKIAKNKLMAGAFNMVDIYLESIGPMLLNNWKKIGKTPKKRVVQLVSEEEIKESIDIAREEREEYLKKKAEEMKKQHEKPQSKREEMYAIKQEVNSGKEERKKPKGREEQKPKEQAPEKTRSASSPTADDSVKAEPHPLVRKPKHEGGIGKMTDEYNKISDKIKKMEAAGKDMYFIKLNTINLRNEMDLLKEAGTDDEKKRMFEKIAKIKKLLNS
ncbi:MAG: hypothetical protein DRN66_04370, partial [Candidatus Nanohalarchaeota archaeon]